LTDKEWAPSTKCIATFSAPANITDYVDVDITQALKEVIKSDDSVSFLLNSTAEISYVSINEIDEKPTLIVY